MKIQFDPSADAAGKLFSDPLEIIRADTPDEVEAAFAAIIRAQEAGHWLAGYLSYELGYCLSRKLAPLMPEARELPLILLGVFAACEEAAPAPAPQDAPALRFADAPPGFDSYQPAFQRVHDYLASGDTYQVNLTFPLELACDGAPAALYAALAARQPTEFGAYVDLGGPVLLSRSPELFFQVDAEGWIETRPMKGTAARGATPEEDHAARDELAASEKNQAENLMIVDLMRNDLSRISEVGSVKVPKLFEIETYETVHQMTSTVRAKLIPGTTLPDILRAIFPCGSVTGAPKIRAMEIIHELEPAPRGVYCGAIGWVSPEAEMRFNVPIRTLTCHSADRITLNVGGGLVYDSTAEAEYREALLKARFTGVADL
ncbi:MAG: aminodeoxychorismate synthase component I [Maritimibacter sp.]